MKYIKETENGKSFMNPLMQPALDSGGEKEEVRAELTGTWREKERHLLDRRASEGSGDDSVFQN